MGYDVGCIGCGNMGGALARAMAAGGAKIALYDTDTQKTKDLARACGAQETDLATCVQESRFLFLGVKPAGMADLLATIAPMLAARPTGSYTLVSMAAGVPLADMEAALGAAPSFIRIMPNTPCAVGAGVIVYAKNAAVDAETERAFLALLSPAGACYPLPEDKMDAAGALSGCGPAYVYLFAEALADAGVEVGLGRDMAAALAAGTLRGAAEMLLQKGNPGALKDAVCSPGGTTIAGVHALESGGLRAATMDAVVAAYRRTAELKK